MHATVAACTHAWRHAHAHPHVHVHTQAHAHTHTHTYTTCSNTGSYIRDAYDYRTVPSCNATHSLCLSHAQMTLSPHTPGSHARLTRPGSHTEMAQVFRGWVSVCGVLCCGYPQHNTPRGERQRERERERARERERERERQKALVCEST